MKKGKKFTAALLCIVMMLTMMPAMAFADGDSTGAPTVIDSNSTNSDSSLQLSKSLEKNGDTYTITMESYLNGDVENIGKATDFVIVLDQSGSMDDKIVVANGLEDLDKLDKELGVEEGLYEAHLFGKASVLGFDVDVDGYYDLRYNQTEKRWEYDKIFGDWTEVGSNQYEVSDIKIKKVGAAKVAVKNFIDMVADETTDTLDHRIAVVGFASTYGNLIKKFNNSEILTGCDIEKDSYLELDVDDKIEITKKVYQGVAYDDKKGTKYTTAIANALVDADSTGLRNVINYFEANGGTYTHEGMQMAEDIFAAAKNADADAYAKRGHVVVVITDGEPGKYGFSTNYANAALNIGNNLKSTYNSKIYTIGLNLNASDSSEVVKFMNYLSSNYSDVKSMSEDKTDPVVDTGYYAAINSSSALTGILNAIASQYTTIPDELKNVDENAVLVDTINSTVFDITGVSKANVSAYTVDMVSGDTAAIDSSNIKVSNGTVSVEGFDYTDTEKM